MNAQENAKLKNSPTHIFKFSSETANWNSRSMYDYTEINIFLQLGNWDGQKSILGFVSLGHWITLPVVFLFFFLIFLQRDINSDKWGKNTTWNVEIVYSLGGFGGPWCLKTLFRLFLYKRVYLFFSDHFLLKMQQPPHPRKCPRCRSLMIYLITLLFITMIASFLHSIKYRIYPKEKDCSKK